MFAMPQNTLAERIKAAMVQAGIQNPAELARKMKVSRQTVQNWVNGRTEKITPELLYRLCDVVNVNGRWMALGDPHSPVRPVFITPDEAEVLQIFKALAADKQSRDEWMSLGRKLVRVSTTPSTANPYPGKK